MPSLFDELNGVGNPAPILLDPQPARTRFVLLAGGLAITAAALITFVTLM